MQCTILPSSVEGTGASDDHATPDAFESCNQACRSDRGLRPRQRTWPDLGRRVIPLPSCADTGMQTRTVREGRASRPAKVKSIRARAGLATRSSRALKTQRCNPLVPFAKLVHTNPSHPPQHVRTAIHDTDDACPDRIRTALMAGKRINKVRLAPDSSGSHTLTRSAIGIPQELLDLGRDPPSSCSAGPTGDNLFQCAPPPPSCPVRSRTLGGPGGGRADPIETTGGRRPSWALTRARTPAESSSSPSPSPPT